MVRSATAGGSPADERRRQRRTQERVDERRLGQRVDLLGERLERRRVARSRGRTGRDGARGRILIVAEREPKTHAQALSNVVVRPTLPTTRVSLNGSTPGMPVLTL